MLDANASASPTVAIDVGKTIDYRTARRGDSWDIAGFLCIAGGGLYEFLFDEVVPFMTAREFLAAGIAGDDAPISHRNCFLAVGPDDESVLGVANAFPAELLDHDSYPLVPVDRLEHIKAMLQLQDRGSMFLNALAVDASCRGSGVGSRLLAWARSQAHDAGLLSNAGSRRSLRTRGSRTVEAF